MLLDHPEGHNKIQDKYKETEFVMVHRHVEPNVHDIKPVNGKGPVHTVNQCQLQDLERTQEDKDSNNPYSSHQGLQVPSYNPDLSRDKSPLKPVIPMLLAQKGNLQHCWCGKWRTQKSTNSECYLLFKVFGQTFLDIAIQFQSPKATLE